ncbi:MAG: TIGR04255 family protein [Leptolyngbyaceae cyanobacterium SM1_4_3]|nr:TIGR04255 family protein [Leptolyngbyaceae cyanobacterium SM1_4_3]
MAEIKFSNPPLTEVVCGVAFDAPEFSSVHFGLYWQKIRDRFPATPVDNPPFVGAGGLLSFSDLPPLRRVWFESSNKKELVQLQADHFYYNWRKQDDQDSYPHFKNIYPGFIREWEEFCHWWEEDIDLLLIPTQYELTYINQIDAEFGWKTPADNQKIFTFEGRNWNGFLSSPSNHVFALQFALPESFGTLSVSGNQAISPLNGEPVMVLELTARSLGIEPDLSAWFNLAHEHIVKGFVDLTQSSIHQDWGIQ